MESIMNNRGPRSTAGKAAIANNHLKHGLAAAAIVLPSESADDWGSFHEDVRARFDAEGAVEVALASRVAELLWRLRRVVRAEEQFVSVVQMHRDTLEHDREVTSQLRQQAAGNDQATIKSELPGRQLLKEKLGQYAAAYIAGETTSRYQETLPVLLPDDPSLDKIMKYEAHLSRLLNHALHELEALQDRRRGNPTHLARLDMN
jgi:hypothetical protein